jgi:fructose-1,6-bisphosphatase I
MSTTEGTGGRKNILGMTVNQHIIENGSKEYSERDDTLGLLLQEILIASKVIRDKVAMADISEIMGSHDEKNVHDETVKLLDIISNDIIKQRLLTSGLVCMVVSEEDKEHSLPEEKYSGGKYVVAIDPCDGSSNIECNAPVGTIFGIWKRRSPCNTVATIEDALQIGRSIICAGYILYGPSCTFVTATTAGVDGFTYDPRIGEFILTHKDIKCPPLSKCYSINEAYTNYWPNEIKNFIDWIKTENKAEGRPYTGRYIGSLVSDFHRNLLYGGIFLYPKDSRSNIGKLRLLYECAPLSFIIEQAGGLGSNGDINILDIVPTSIHQREQLFIGNKSDVLIAEDFLKGIYPRTLN